MDVVSVDGLDIAYERAGRGPAMVLLHGYVGDGPATWTPQLEQLCDQFTVIAWDAPGAGRSSDPPETIGMAGYADCLAGFIRELRIDRPHLVGLSFGGALAIEFCHRHPRGASTATLAGAYAGWGGSLPPEDVDKRLEQALALSELTGEQFADTLLPSMFTEGTYLEVVESFRQAMLEFHPVGFRAMARAVTEDLRPALPHMSVPTLLLYGENDIRAPREVAEHLHTAISDSTLVSLPGSGHVCSVEAPAEFSEAVRSFIVGP